MSSKKTPNQELHRITSTAIIFKKEGSDFKYLILKRSPDKKAFPNMWTVPGGGLETDDYTNTPMTTKDHWYFAIETSLRREIKEECNLEVGKVKYLLDMAFIRPDNMPVIILSFYCNYKSGKVELDEDNVEAAWVKVKDLKNYEIIEGISEEIEMVDKILKGKDENKVKHNFKA